MRRVEDLRRRRDPRRLGDLLSAYLDRVGLQEVAQAQRLVAAWRAVVPAAVFDGTRLVKLLDGVLHVGVKSSPLLYELEGFRKREIVSSLREALAGRVTDVRFRLEATAGSGPSRTRGEP